MGMGWGPGERPWMNTGSDSTMRTGVHFRARGSMPETVSIPCGCCFLSVLGMVSSFLVT